MFNKIWTKPATGSPGCQRFVLACSGLFHWGRPGRQETAFPAGHNKKAWPKPATTLEILTLAPWGCSKWKPNRVSGCAQWWGEWRKNLVQHATEHSRYKVDGTVLLCIFTWAMILHCAVAMFVFHFSSARPTAMPFTSEENQRYRT